MRVDKTEKIILALITEPTRKKACQAAGISERTLYNYMQDADFMDEYHSVLNGIVTDTTSRMKEAAHKAAEHLISVIEDETIDAATRLKADRIVLELVVKIAENEAALKHDMFDSLANMLYA